MERLRRPNLASSSNLSRHCEPLRYEIFSPGPHESGLEIETRPSWLWLVAAPTSSMNQAYGQTQEARPALPSKVINSKRSSSELFVYNSETPNHFEYTGHNHFTSRGQSLSCCQLLWKLKVQLTWAGDSLGHNLKNVVGNIDIIELCTVTLVSPRMSSQASIIQWWANKSSQMEDGRL